MASVIIGETLSGKRNITYGLIFSVVGSIIYRFIMAFAISATIFPAYMLKLISAVIVGIALAMPSIKSKLEQNNKRRRH